MKKIPLLISASLLASSVLLAKEVKIGVILPMTGQLAAFGQTTITGINLANKMQPKLKNGDDIKIILVDNKGDKVETSSAATRLISSDNVVGILGPTTSTNAAQVLSICEKKHVPMISATSTLDKLFDGKTYGNRVCFMDSFQGNVVANYAVKESLKTAVTIIDQAQVYSIGLAKAFKTAYTKAGGKVLKTLSITSGDKDFKAVVSQIKSLNPDMIYVPMYHPEASMIARQAKQIGLNKPMFSGDGVANPTFIELGGDAVEGYMFTDFFDSTVPPTEKSKEFIAAHEKETGKKDVNSFTALGADTYFILVNAMNNCKNPEDSICVNKMIKQTKNFEGVSGILNIDKNGNAIRSAVIKEIKNAKPVFKASVNP